MSEVHANEHAEEEPKDEIFSENDIVAEHGDCISAVYPLRIGDVIKLSNDHELTTRNIDGVNKMICIEFSENGESIDDEVLMISTRDTTWDICFFQENE